MIQFLCRARVVVGGMAGMLAESEWSVLRRREESGFLVELKSSAGDGVGPFEDDKTNRAFPPFLRAAATEPELSGITCSGHTEGSKVHGRV